MVKQTQKLKPQVFINFRGAELRQKFVNHLVWVLKQAGINVFIDNHERKGEKLDNLFNRIEQSTMAITILSEKYSESKWCLNELVKINELMEQKKLAVIPVFYKVSTNDVKGKAVPQGNFTINFNQTKQNYAEQPDMVKNWEPSLASMTKRIGFSSSSYGNDLDLVSAIVKEVKRQLHMPIDSNFSCGDVAFLALVAHILFTFTIAPKAFPEGKFFQTPEWFLSVSTIIVASWLLYLKWRKP